MTEETAASLRRATVILAVIWALLSLALAVVGQLSTHRSVDPPLRTTLVGSHAVVSYASREAEAAGIAPGDHVLDVNGVPVARWYRERGWREIRPGKPIHYRVATSSRGLREVDLLPTDQISLYERFRIPIFASLAMVGTAFLLLGVFVWRLKPDREESFAFLLFSAVTAAVFYSAVHTYDAPLGYERLLMNMPLLGATMFHLFSVFPVEPDWVVRHPRVRFGPYALAGLVASAVVADRLAGEGDLLSALSILSFGLTFVLAALSVGMLLRERLRLPAGASARGADIVLGGVLGSLLPVVLLLAAELLLPVEFPPSVAMVWFVAFPVAVAVGIVRGDLFPVPAVSRSSAVYGALTLAITGLFAFLITAADAAFRRLHVDSGTPFFAVTFLFFAILAVNPLRDRLQTLLDRVFDRDRSAHRSAVREISEAMVSMLSLSEISERLLSAVTDAMGVDRAMVLLLSEGDRRLRPMAWRGDWDADARRLAIPVDHPIAKNLWMRRQELTRRDFDEITDSETRDACRDVFDGLEAKLLVPILFGVDLLGVIAVGAKLSGERLVADDRQLLRTLANQAAIAIENAEAFDEIAKLNETLEARVEERTRELRAAEAQLLQSEKMRSLGQLVAGVAHELNNPIGFVHANLQLLDGYIGKLLAAQDRDGDIGRPMAAIAKLLARSREGTERVKKIVMDLRSFSRMDEAELADADLNQEIERTLALMEARFKDGVAVERDFGDLPPVRCYPAQLNQVFMNLLMNSCDAMEGKGRIRITTRGEGDRILLEFADDGPGVPQDVRARIFEPFFTTKPVGKGTGLGLSISHGIIDRHGGRMELEATGGRGALFRIDLPRVARPPTEVDFEI